MKINTLIAILFCCFACVALGDAKSDVKKVTERFYEQYLQLVNSNKADEKGWVKKCKDLTPEFKAAYAALLKAGELDHDPILCAQDVPPSPFKATAISVTGETATATMVVGRADWDNEPRKLQLVQRGGAWVINAINDLKGK